MAEVPDSQSLSDEAKPTSALADTTEATAQNNNDGMNKEASWDRRILEVLLFAAGEPLSASRLCEITGWSKEMLRLAVEDLNREYREQHHAFSLEEVAGGYVIFTLPSYANWVRKLRKREEEEKLTPAAMETLAVIAYRQPITRAEIDAIRGVQSSAVLGGLLERRLIRIAGRSEELGRPMLYGTTKEFLKLFGLAGLKELPRKEEFREWAAPAAAIPEGGPAAAFPT